MTGTGVACTEGVGLGLFIPLAQGIEGDGAAGRLGTFVLAPFAGLPPATRGRAILVAIVVLLAVRNLLVLAHAAMAGRVTSDLAHELRTDAMAAVLAADETTLARRDTGAWLALLESQTWETAAAAGTLLGIATRVGRIAVFAAGLLWISPPTTAVVLAALGLVSIGVRRLARRVDALGDAEKRAWEAMAQRMVEILRALRTVRVFGREAHELDRLAWVSDVERGTFRRLQLLQAVVPPASELLVATLMLAVVWVSLATPGQVPAALAVLAILYRLHPQVAQLDGLRVALAAGRAPAEAVTALLASSPPARPAAAPVPAPLARGITFRDVSYTHADGTRGLAGASLVIPAGRTTVVVGPSGAGKSTLVRLLLRLAEPEHGTIEADGVPLAAVDAAAWRARIAVVGQDIPLLDATIAENVAYGAGGRLDLDAIRAAARRADADAFVMALPDRYATRMGAGGVRLSGGERQRVALARALARDPEILVLDEATNAVDGISTALILRTLLEVGRGRTVVVVTHRADLVDAAEHVVVLDAGRVVEHGSAAALAGRGGLFARLRTAGAPPAARAS